MANRKPHVIICPLNWGLGHSSRCIPIIDLLLTMDAKVTVAASLKQRKFIYQSFEEKINYVSFPGYEMQYFKTGFSFSLILQAPLILGSIIFEYFFLNIALKKLRPDLVISDNRYGARLRGKTSVFISHQINPIPPGVFKFALPVAKKTLRYLLSGFTECWVPDCIPPENLSGILSNGEGIHGNLRYIGLLSRFEKMINLPEGNKGSSYTVNEHFILIVLSGPEPERSRFEKILINSGIPDNQKVVLVRGLPGPIHQNLDCPQSWDVYHSPNPDLLISLIKNASLIICRPGYSSLMDLMTIGRKAFLVPTPGQTEQEYLGERLNRLYGFGLCKQSCFSFQQALSFMEKNLFTTQFKNSFLIDKNLLNERLVSLLENKNYQGD